MPLPKVPMQITYAVDGSVFFHVEQYRLHLKPDENEDYNFVELETWATDIVTKAVQADQDKIELRRKLQGLD